MKEPNQEKMNQTFYRQTFDEIHASRELLGKVNSMKKETKTHAARIGLAIAAAAAICFISSNIATYAATGSSWVQKIVIYFNGEANEVDLNYKTDLDGNGYYEAVIEDDSEIAYFVIGDDGGELPDSISIDECVDDMPTLVTEDGRIYLVAKGQTIEVTEDIADEVCDGSFTADGVTYTYHITGTATDYHIELYSELGDEDYVSSSSTEYMEYEE